MLSFPHTADQTAWETYLTHIADGDRDALAALYEQTRTAVYGYTLSLLKNPHDAEDVLQDVYLRVWNSAAAYRSHGKPLAWLLTIAKNLSTDRMRAGRHVAEVSEEQWLTFCADSPAVTNEDRWVLQAALRQLEETERQILMLHAVSGLKHREISELTGLPLPTVLSKYHRSKKKLAAILQEECV